MLYYDVRIWFENRGFDNAVQKSNNCRQIIEVFMVGRVKINDVEGVMVMGELRKEFFCGHRVKHDAVLQIPLGEELSNKAAAFAVGFVHDHLRPTATSFETDLPGTGKQIEEPFAW